MKLGGSGDPSRGGARRDARDLVHRGGPRPPGGQNVRDIFAVPRSPPRVCRGAQGAGWQSQTPPAAPTGVYCRWCVQSRSSVILSGAGARRVSDGIGWGWHAPELDTRQAFGHVPLPERAWELGECVAKEMEKGEGGERVPKSPPRLDPSTMGLRREPRDLGSETRDRDGFRVS